MTGDALPPRSSSTIGFAPTGRDRLVDEDVAQLVAALEGAREPEQLVLDLVERALGPGDLEQRRGVALDAILRRHARDPTCSM